MKVKRALLGVRVTAGLEGTMTAWAGISPLIMLERKCGLVELGDRVLPVKGSSRGLRSGEMLECFALMSAMGGECYDDMERLRADAGLSAMLGYAAPSAETARQWLDKFHDESLMAGRPLQGSFLPPESKYLAGLEEANRKIIWAYVKAVLPPTWQIPESQWASSGVGQREKDGQPQLWVTLDIDAHLVETHKGLSTATKDTRPFNQWWSPGRRQD